MLKATFIGINKHQDRTIRELTGAVRDATAFWALIQDTVPDAACELVVDHDASAAKIRSVIADLASATAADVVVLAFSGHGTRSQRLVAFDTDRASIDASTIGMDEVADAFRKSKAKAILCVVDCCFSGGAPARVLDDSPVARDVTTPLEALAGNGRVLIAACSTNEVAYESPTTRHGLLTGALLAALQNSGEMPDILELSGAVLDTVRAAATKLGVTQTPVFLGHVEGGLKLPRLVAGKEFFNAFPDRRGAKIGQGVNELAEFGIPTEIVNAWVSQFPTLNALQLAAVNEHRIMEGESLVVVAPTSSGKTFIGEMAAARAIVDGRKAVFLLPYRALVNEKFDSFAALYGERLGLRVIRCTGDYSDSASEFVRGQYDLALLTYEMFLNLIVASPTAINSIGLVVLDESQFITDPMRGISVELLLTFLLTARQRGVLPQLIALSAVIGDVNHFDEWLGSRRLMTTQRPVPLIEGVLDRNGTFQFVGKNGEDHTEQLLPRHAIQVRKDKPSAQDVIVPLVRQLLSGTNEKVIVFRNQRGAAEGCAAYLAKDLGLPPAEDALGLLPLGDVSSTSDDLRFCLSGGTAFHNTNLTREEKQLVERAYRNPSSSLRVLGATTTVAAGINTPASTVIIAEQEFIGEDGRPFTVAEYKNMAGRAGRLGFNEKGKAIILAETSFDRARLFQKYVRGTLEPLRSSFDPRHLDTWIVRLLGHVKRVPRTDVALLLLNTYGGYLIHRNDPSWEARVRQDVERLMTEMLTLGLLEEELGDVQLTLLGRACAHSSLSFRSAMRLVELIRQIGAGITGDELMAIVQALPEVDDAWTPMMKKGTRENVRASEASSRFSPRIVQMLQRYAGDTITYLARCKRASILADWIRGVPTEAIERAYSTTPFQGKVSYGDIRRFADVTRFHLRAAHQITNVLLLPAGPAEDTIEKLLRRLEEGLPEEALGLLALPVSLDRGGRLALYNAGLRTPADIWKLQDDELITLVGSLSGPSLVARRPRSAHP